MSFSPYDGVSLEIMTYQMLHQHSGMGFSSVKGFISIHDYSFLMSTHFAVLEQDRGSDFESLMGVEVRWRD